MKSAVQPTLVLLLAAVTLAGGCSEEPGSDAGRIVPRSEGFFTDQPGAVLGPLVVQVLSPPIRNVPGRTGFRDPVRDVAVTFEVDKPEALTPVLGESAELAKDDSASESLTVKTDETGKASAWVRLPVAIGDWRLKASVLNQYATEKTVEFRVGAGVKVRMTDEVNSVGGKVQVAVQVFRVEQGNVLPDSSAHVWFQIDGAIESEARLGKGRIADRVRVTPQEGVATSELILGDRPGVYRVLATPFSLPEGATPVPKGEGGRPSGPGPGGFRLPSVILRGIAVDWTQTALEIGAGSLLFLLGLRLLANGLLNLLGPALALPVTSFSRGRLRGFLGGTAAGALFGTSTSVVSRLVSFANGGLLPLAGAAGIILGADLGRTLLPQLLAFPVGIGSVVLLALGVFALFLPRRFGLYAWGWVLLGTGLVILGSWSFSQGVDIARLSPVLRRRLAAWDYTSLAGTNAFWSFATAASGAAALGFLFRNTNLLVVAGIVLGNAGLISASAALPIIVGATLGPALSLFVSTLGRRRPARRVALLQLLFQLVGMVWLSVLSLVTIGGSPAALYLAEWLTPGLLFHPNPEHVGHHVAMVYTAYNLLNGVLCLTLSGALLALTERLIPRDPIAEDVKPYHLDPNLIEVPALAILQASHEVTFLAELCRKAIAESFDAFRYRDLKLADQTTRREESIASVHRDVSLYLLRVGENDLSLREASRLEILQSTTANLVRIGHLGERLRDLTARQIEDGGEPPEEVIRDLNDSYDLVMGQFDNVLRLLEGPDGRTEENAVKLAERLAKFGSRVEQAWFEKLRRGELDNGTDAAGKEATPPAVAPPAGGADGGTSPAPASRQDLLLAESAPASRPEARGSVAPERRLREPARELARILIYHDALEVLFQVAGHLSHVAERMRVLTP